MNPEPGNSGSKKVRGANAVHFIAKGCNVVPVDDKSSMSPKNATEFHFAKMVAGAGQIDFSEFLVSW